MYISVALCTYNGADYLKCQLLSIVSQTKSVDEIIICDDCSTDDTIKIIELISLQHPNLIKLYQNKIRLGVKQNFERAILLCSGDFIFLSDQDDIWINNKVEIFIKYFNNFPEISVFFSNGLMINENNKSLNKTLWDTLYFNIYRKLINFSFLDLFDYILSFDYLVTGATIGFKKNFKKKLLPFPPESLKNFWHDQWISIVASASDELGFINENLIYYRIHDGQQVGLNDQLDSNYQRFELIRNLKTKSGQCASKFFPVSFYSGVYEKIRFISKYHHVNENYFIDVRSKLTSAKIIFLEDDNYIKKRLRLIIWVIRGLYGTEWKDIFKL